MSDYLNDLKPKEKRRDIRHSLKKPIEVLLHGHSYMGDIINRSRSGIFIRIKGPFKVGEEVSVIEALSIGEDQKRKAKIIRITSNGIAIAFERPGYF